MKPSADSARTRRIAYAAEEMRRVMDGLSDFFDSMRLIAFDPLRELAIASDGAIVERPYARSAAFCTEDASENGVCLRAYSEQACMLRLDFAGDELVETRAQYVEVDGRGCVLEMILRVTDGVEMDVNARKQLITAISGQDERLYVDPVTGVLNRRYYHDRCEMLEGQRAVAMIDVDDFKRVNDDYSHAMGDAVLRRIAESIAACIRPADRLVRFGGDEFVILFDGIPESALQTRLEAICRRVRGIRMDGAPELKVSVSIGGAFGKGRVPELIHAADGKCYEAKKTKNCART